MQYIKKNIYATKEGELGNCTHDGMVVSLGTRYSSPYLFISVGHSKIVGILKGQQRWAEMSSCSPPTFRSDVNADAKFIRNPCFDGTDRRRVDILSRYCIHKVGHMLPNYGPLWPLTRCFPLSLMLVDHDKTNKRDFHFIAEWIKYSFLRLRSTTIYTVYVIPNE